MRAGAADRGAAEAELQAWTRGSIDGCVGGGNGSLLVHVSPDVLTEDETRAWCRSIRAELPLNEEVECSRSSDALFRSVLPYFNACHYRAIVSVRAGDDADSPRIDFWRHSPEPSSASRALPAIARESLASGAGALRVAALVRLAAAGAPMDDRALLQETLLAGALSAGDLRSIERTPEGLYIRRGESDAAPLSLDEAWREATLEKPGLLQWLTVLLEITGEIGGGAAYYYGNRDWSVVDWDLDSSDWRNKLLLSPYTVSFDTNDFAVNAIGHPMAGMFYYLIARGNRFSPVESMAIAFVASYLWEVSVEFQEKTSINDMYFTPFAGSVIGEAVHQWTTYASCHLKARKTLSACVSIARTMDADIGMRLDAGMRSSLDGGGSDPVVLTRVSGVFDQTPVEEEGGVRLRAGEWSSLLLSLGLVPGGRPGEEIPAGLEAEFRSLLTGIKGLAWSGTSAGIWWIDLDQGYFLRDMPFSGTRDRYAFVEILGTTARLTIIRGGIRAEFELRLTADLGVIDAWALSGALSKREFLRADSSLREQGYSHSGGGSATLKVRLSDVERNFELEAMVQDRRVVKMKGWDRFPERAISPVDTADERLRARIDVGVRIPETRAHVGVVAQLDTGRSRVESNERRLAEGRLLGTLRYDF